MDLSSVEYGIYKTLKYAVFPLSWALIAGLLTILTAWLPVTPRRTTWVRRFSVWGFVILWLTATPACSALSIGWLESRYLPFSPDSAMRADAIVVLAGGVYAKGTLRPNDEPADASRQRTTCGVDLWLSSLAPKIVLTGGDAGVYRTGPLESHAMKRWAQRLGVPPSAILLEDRSRTTYENAVQSKALLGSGHILLVTAAYHLPRAVRLFERQGFTVTPVACGYESKHRPSDIWAHSTPFDFFPSAKHLVITTQAVEEYVGIAVYWLTGKL